MITVALHTGQLLQPVPGGIGRYQRAMLDHLAVSSVRPLAFAAGPARRTSRRACRGSTSARRGAACATSCGTASGGRWCGSTPT